MISDFSHAIYLLSYIIPKLQVGILFKFYSFSRTNEAKIRRILNHAGELSGSTTYILTDFWSLLEVVWELNWLLRNAVSRLTATLILRTATNKGASTGSGSDDATTTECKQSSRNGSYRVRLGRCSSDWMGSRDSSKRSNRNSSKLWNNRYLNFFHGTMAYSGVCCWLCLVIPGFALAKLIEHRRWQCD